MKRSKRSEMRKICNILSQIIEMAEEGAFPGGLTTSVKRYNSILRHLEESEILPNGLFISLPEQEGAVTQDQIGVDCRMLVGYLEDEDDDGEGESSGKVDFGPVIALAPFLEKGELKKILRMHLTGHDYHETEEEEEDQPTKTPDLKLLVSLAPHMGKRELGELVAACLERREKFDPKLIVALAPHMDREELSRLLKKHLPDWFGAKNSEGEEPTPASFGTDLTPAFPKHEPWNIKESE